MRKNAARRSCRSGSGSVHLFPAHAGSRFKRPDLVHPAPVVYGFFLCDPFTALQCSGALIGDIVTLITEIGEQRAGQNQTHPHLDTSLLTKLTALVDKLYLHSGGQALRSHLKVSSKGMTGRCLFGECPVLGLLHLFCIRGWLAILNAIGISALADGSGPSLIQRFFDFGVFVHFYEQHGTVKFGSPGSKGHDALGVWFNIREVLCDLSADFRDRLGDIVTLWMGMWFMSACPSYLYPELGEPMKSVEEVGLWLKRSGDTLHLLLLNTLGKITPTIHQAVTDVPREYMRSGGRLRRNMGHNKMPCSEKCQTQHTVSVKQ